MTAYPTAAIGTVRGPAPLVDVVLPVKTIPGDNAREHWRTKARRVKHQRGLAGIVLRGALMGILDRRGVGAVLVLLTRLAPSKGLDAHDGLPGSQKAIVDGIADAMGLASDSDPRVMWTYAQEDSRKVPKDSALRASLVRGYGVRIQVLRRG